MTKSIESESASLKVEFGKDNQYSSDMNQTAPNLSTDFTQESIQSYQTFLLRQPQGTASSRDDQYDVDEYTSLLPLYSEQNYDATTFPPTYLKIILNFIWKYLVPDALKQYFENHTSLEILIIILLILGFAFVLYYTGQIALFPAYVKIILCVVSTWFDNLPFGFTCN